MRFASSLHSFEHFKCLLDDSLLGRDELLGRHYTLDSLLHDSWRRGKRS